jgi:thiosulfate dehydrogenase
VPDDTEREHTRPDYDETTFPLVFKEKVRHGAFLGFAGTMPPFATETLSEPQVDDLMAYIRPVLR